jgi:hypothetical protein
MLDVFGEIALQRVVAGHLVEFAALLVEADPQPPLLAEDVSDDLPTLSFRAMPCIWIKIALMRVNAPSSFPQ